MQTPEPGLYYHYKRNADDPIEKYAYEVVGLAKHTETNEELVVYRPLYKSEYSVGVEYLVRPKAMFMEHVRKDGVLMRRFQRIEDTDTVQLLLKVA